MTVCRFFEKGHCRNGTACRFEHPTPTSSNTRPQINTNNRFGALNGGSNSSATPSNNALDKYKIIPDTITADLSTDLPQWILSAYAPGRDAPDQLFGGNPREQSFEEMRLHHLQSPDTAQALKEAQELWKMADEQNKAALRNVNVAADYVVQGEQRRPNRHDVCAAGTQGAPWGEFEVGKRTLPGAGEGGESLNPFSGRTVNAFAPQNQLGQSSAFGQPSQPVQATSGFGQPSQLGASTGAFGQPSQPASTFGQPSQLGASISAFGQPASTFGQPSQLGGASTSAFGQPSQPASTFGQPSQPGTSTSTFGQPSQPGTSTSTFGQPSQPGASTSAFGQPSQPVSTFGQPSQPGASTSAFGKPSQPVSTFGQPSQLGDKPSAFAAAAPTTNNQAPNPFGQPSQTSSFGQPSQLGQTAPNPFATSTASTPAAANPFGQPSTQPQTNGFSQPANLFSQKQAPPAAATAAAAATSNPYPPDSTRTHPPVESYTSKDASGRLSMFKGKMVVYRDNNPGVRMPDGGWKRIWFPNGPPVCYKATALPTAEYDNATMGAWEAFVRTGRFEGGVPEVAPPRDCTLWNF